MGKQLGLSPPPISSLGRPDPVGYNGVVHDFPSPSTPSEQVRLLALDWLTVNLVRPKTKSWDRLFRVDEEYLLPFEPDKVYEEGEVFCSKQDSMVELIHLGMGTKNYRHRFTVVVEGHPVGTLIAFPRSLCLPQHQAQFQLENHLFYTSGGVVALIEQVCKGLEADVFSISELHIAHDSQENKRILDFIDAWHFSRGEKFEPLGKDITKAGRFRPFFNGKPQYVKSFDWGSKGGSKRLTCYDKTDWLQAKETKAYITDFHELNGIQATKEKPVIRVEIKLKKKALDKIKDFDWRRLEDANYLASVYEFHLKNWFEFVPTDGLKERCRRERVKLIDFSNLQVQKLDRAQYKPQDDFYSIRIAIKQAEKHFFLTEQKEFQQLAQKYVQLYRLDLWYESKLSRWVDRWRKKYPNKDSKYETVSHLKKAC